MNSLRGGEGIGKEQQKADRKIKNGIAWNY